VDQIRSQGATVAARMAGGGEDLATRPAPDVWSRLEYGCHVRDVLLMQRDRLYVALVEETPSFKPMYREQRVDFDGYATQEPAAVAHEVAMAIGLIGRAFDRLRDEQWERSLRYNFPEPSTHDVEWMAHHTLHELVHHLRDIDRQSHPA